MILVDKEIATLVEQEGLIDSFDPRCLTNIGYDVRAKCFAVGKENMDHVSLQPGESVFVSSVETIDMPENLLCQVVLKNSRIRQGFTIDAPVYQPGHHTRVFFRLTNVSGNELSLDAGDMCATLVFEQLSQAPEHPYTGAFKDEFDFSGLGEYQDIYKRQIRVLEKKSEDLKSVEHTIYANVLVILTVFVALFSFLTTNISLLSVNADISKFLLYNFVILGCVSFLVALLDGVINRAVPTRRQFLRWIPAVVCLGTALLLFLLL